MSGFATVKSNFTSYGREELGFYDNIDKINKWKKKYKFHNGIEELFDTVNFSGSAGTYEPSRAYYTAYVLTKEGYEVEVYKTNNRGNLNVYKENKTIDKNIK